MSDDYERNLHLIAESIRDLNNTAADHEKAMLQIVESIQCQQTAISETERVLGLQMELNDAMREGLTTLLKRAQETDQRINDLAAAFSERVFKSPIQATFATTPWLTYHSQNRRSRSDVRDGLCE